MSARFLRRALSLAMLVWAGAAQADRVVVLEFRHDKGGALRSQVERGLKGSGSLHVVPLRDFKVAAAKKKLRGPRAMTASAVAEVSTTLGLSAAVAGSRGKALLVQVLDRSGREIWAKEIALKRGRVSHEDQRRLAAAVEELLAPPPKLPEEKKAEAEEPKPETPEEREKARREEMAEAHTAIEPQLGSGPSLESRRKLPRPGPKIFSAQVTGTTTWRTYCSRPGVAGCSQYNSLDPAQRPPGDTVDFKAEVPYVGFSLSVEVFPFAKADSFLRGFGLLGNYDRGFSQTNVRVQTSASPDVTQRQVYSSDQGISALASYRYFFAVDAKAEPLVGYGGLRAGFMARTFDVDQNAAAPLPGSHRRYATIGVEALYPVKKFLKFGASGNYFIGPKPSTSEINDYGSKSNSHGWGLEMGASGDVTGPLGYTLQFKLSKYTDQFSGVGSKWLSGGIAEETYLSLYWGATAHF